MDTGISILEDSSTNYPINLKEACLFFNRSEGSIKRISEYLGLDVFYKSKSGKRIQYKFNKSDIQSISNFLTENPNTNQFFSEITCREKYGCSNPMQNSGIKKKVESTCLKKYGVSSYSKTKECSEKIKNTSLERYGVTSFTKTKEFKEKSENTCLEKYGVKNYSQTEECQEKIKETCLKKYNVPHSSQNERVKEKLLNTCLEKYGVTSFSKTKKFKEAVSKTSLEKYGESSYMKTEEGKQKVRDTCLKKYGVENYAQTEENYKKRKHKIEVERNNKLEKFDSSYEIIIFDWLMSKKINFIRNFPIEYDCLGKNKKYFCDFYLPDMNILLEAKNPAFLTNDGKIKSVFKKGLSQEKFKELGIRDDFKLNAMIKRKVFLVTDKSKIKEGVWKINPPLIIVDIKDLDALLANP